MRYRVKEVTNLILNDFKIRELNHDFMGYSLQKGDIYTYHHFLIPRRQGGPYSYNNGVILAVKTSHPYYHVIECYEPHQAALITSEFLDMKVKGFLDDENLKNIGEILSEFEYKYRDKYTRKGKKLIKDVYLQRKFK